VPGATVVAVLAGCSGRSALQACVQHSVGEGVARDVAEQACREAGRTD
jgi:hypothetical protein